MQVLRSARAMAKDELGVSCELIDLRTIIPWDMETVAQVIYQHTLLSCMLKKAWNGLQLYTRVQGMESAKIKTITQFGFLCDMFTYEFYSLCVRLDGW